MRIEKIEGTYLTELTLEEDVPTNMPRVLADFF